MIESVLGIVMIWVTALTVIMILLMLVDITINVIKFIKWYQKRKRAPRPTEQEQIIKE